ncbi:hypothetical protein [Cloacibacillus sp. An23]|uniref:hypothetical protein n=1 Tax=Cloacibacillus sp. An23 TaxID=1965591 RepID=UPI001302D741|nr:hypothetical protein [Cloacibacillus sp. An23]
MVEYRVTQKQLRALEDLADFIKQAEACLDVETAFLRYIVDCISEQPLGGASK